METQKVEHGGLLKMAKFITQVTLEITDSKQVCMTLAVQVVMVCLEYLLTQVVYGIVMTRKLFIWFVLMSDIQLYGL